MNPLSEKNYRSLFKASIIVKGLISIGELALGFLFVFVSHGALRHAVFALTGDELRETPPDFIWGYVIQGLHGFAATPQSVWAFIFLSHGIVKLILIAGLLRDRLWAYPWSAAIFSLFIVYQIWQMAFTPSLILLLITILDVVVVGLALHEYHHRLHGMRAKKEQLL